MHTSFAAGRSLARLSSVLLLLDVFLIAITIVTLYVSTGFHDGAIGFLMGASAFPAAVYSIWALGLFGTVGALIAISLYGYHERWFWRCLVIAACGWLVFPPIHTLLGVLALIMLIASRRKFVPAPQSGAP